MKEERKERIVLECCDHACSGKTCFQYLIVNQAGSEFVAAPGTEQFAVLKRTKNTPYIHWWVKQHKYGV